MTLTLSTYLDTLDHNVPPEHIGHGLRALWWAGKNDWTEAHEIVQAHEGEPDSDWVHAWLHRREGDNANARYWYRRARRSMHHGSLDDEWRAIVTALIAGSGY